MIVDIIRILIVLGATALVAVKPIMAYLNYLNAVRAYENRRYNTRFSEEVPQEEAPVAPKVLPSILGAVATLVITTVLVSMFAIVPAGQRGVVFSQATGVEERVLPEGLSIVIPIVESVHLMDVRTDSVTFKLDKSNPAASSDGQDVYMKVTVSYHPLPEKVNTLWQEVGDREAFESKILGREVLQVTKAVIPSHQAQDIFAKREVIRDRTMAQLNERATIKDYIMITSVSIENVDFKPEFRDLLERKAQRTQDLEIARKDVEIAEQAKQKKIKQSEAVQQSTKNIADGQAYKNTVLAKSVTEKSLDARYADILEIYANKYQGGVPATYINMGATSGGGSPMLPVMALDQLMKGAAQQTGTQR